MSNRPSPNRPLDFESLEYRQSPSALGWGGPISVEHDSAEIARSQYLGARQLILYVGTLVEVALDSDLPGPIDTHMVDDWMERTSPPTS